MNERKTKGLTNLNSDEKIIRDTCGSLARMYFSQFAAISCRLYLYYLPKFRRNLQVCSFDGLFVRLSVCVAIQVAVFFYQLSPNFIHTCSLFVRRTLYSSRSKVKYLGHEVKK